MRRLPLSLRTRLTATATAAVALVLAGTALIAYLVVDNQLSRQLDLSIIREATSLELAVKRGESVARGECQYLSSPACAQVVRADVPVPKSGAVGSGRLPVTSGTKEVASGGRPAYFSDAEVGGYPVRMLTEPMAGERALQVAIRSDSTRRSIDRIGLVMLVVTGIGTLVAALLGHLVSRTGLRPVARLTAIAERIAATRDPTLRIELPQPPPQRLPHRDDGKPPKDELVRLAASFNVMLGELEASLAAQRQLVADASHELRTPLTSLRTNIDILTGGGDRLTEAHRARATVALRGQLREVTDLVNDLIELARGEEPEALLEDVRLDVVAEHCVQAAAGHWPAVRFAVDAGPVVVSGVPSRLARLITNLLDNAAKFSAPGGEVALTVRQTPDGTANLSVRDHGPGVPPEDLPHIFDRFYRARSARALPGSGLGLAMARQIAQSHNGTLTAQNASTGGTEFRLSISPPAAP
jgi:two-component system sensor histidine kinase MprB